jgi:hypothetical protein
MQSLYFSKKDGVSTWEDLKAFAEKQDIQSELVCEMYGIGGIIRRLCFLPSWFPLRILTQHGVSFWEVPPSHELTSPFLFHLVHNRRWVEIFRKHGREKVIATGSFFVAYRRLFFRKTGLNVARKKGAIAYISHSTFWEKAEWRSDALFEQLNAIAAREGTVTLCFHFVDILNEKAKPFFDAGYTIATSGHYLNRNFPLNFYSILSDHSMIYSNAVGSHVLYAIEAGFDVNWLELPFEMKNVALSESDWADTITEKPIINQLEALLRSGKARNPEALELCEQELGLSEMIGRARLLGIVLASSIYWHFWLRSRKLWKCSLEMISKRSR